MVVCIITLYVVMAGMHLSRFRNCCQIQFIMNTSMNFSTYNVHLSFVCCLVVTCFNVLLSILLCANSSLDVVVICCLKLFLCISRNCYLKLLMCTKFGLLILLCNGTNWEGQSCGYYVALLFQIKPKCWWYVSSCHLAFTNVVFWGEF